MSVELSAGARELRSFVRDVPDFPKPGILFKDITPLLASPAAFAESLERMIEPFSDLSAIVGIESRGFIFGAALAARLDVGFVPVRKPGKLPHETERVEYELEYGTDALEIHRDAVGPSDRVLIVDDVIATGGTAAATVELTRGCGAQVVGCAFLIELEFLRGRDKLGDVPVHSVLRYA